MVRFIFSCLVGVSFVLSTTLATPVTTVATESEVYKTGPSNPLDNFNLGFVNGDPEMMVAASAELQNSFTDILKSDYLLQMTAEALAALLDKPWIVEEVEVFRAVDRWYEVHHRSVSESEWRAILNRVHLIGMTTDTINNVVVPSKLIPCEQVVQILAVNNSAPQNLNEYMRFPGQQFMGRNLIDGDLGARVVSGSDPAGLLLRPLKEFYAKRRDLPAAYHTIPGADCPPTNCEADKGITVELKYSSLINNVMVYLFDGDGRSYSFYIDTSVDAVTWTRAANRTGLYRAELKVPITTRLVKYVRLVGTRTTIPNNNVFHIYSLEAWLAP